MKSRVRAQQRFAKYFLAAAVLIIGYKLLSPPAMVDQSIGPRTLATTPSDIASTFPLSAIKIEYAQSGVGIGGRFLAYRFTAPIDDLRAHLSKRFSTLPPGALPKPSKKVPSLDLALFEKAYRVDLSWFDVLASDNCEVYRRPIEEHSPIVVLNLDSNTLYYPVSYTHLRAPRDATLSRMPSSA